MNIITRSLTLSLGLLLAAAMMCAAQESYDPDSLVYRFSLGIGPGTSQPLTKMKGRGIGDPYHLFDNTEAHVAIAMTYSFRITREVTIEGVVDGFTLGHQHRLPRTQETYAKENFPGELLAASSIDEQTILAPGLGISYRIRLGPFILLPSLLATYVDAKAIRASLLLKREGTNEYRSITHNTSDGGGFTVVPAVIARYQLGSASSRWGLQLRAAYLHADFDLAHTIVEEKLNEAPRVASFTERHTLDAVNLQVGAYYNLF